MKMSKNLSAKFMIKLTKFMIKVTVKIEVIQVNPDYCSSARSPPGSTTPRA